MFAHSSPRTYYRTSASRSNQATTSTSARLRRVAERREGQPEKKTPAAAAATTEVEDRKKHFAPSLFPLADRQPVLPATAAAAKHSSTNTTATGSRGLRAEPLRLAVNRRNERVLANLSGARRETAIFQRSRMLALEAKGSSGRNIGPRRWQVIAVVQIARICHWSTSVLFFLPVSTYKSAYVSAL